MQQRRTFTQDFKRNLVEAYHKGDKTARQLADENDIPVSFIYRWKGEVENGGRDNKKETPKRKESNSELEQLRQENQKLKAKLYELILDK